MNRLKELRLGAGLSQAHLAEAAETTQRNISYWESGKIELNLYAALRLAQIFQVDVEYLAGYSDELNIKPDISLPKTKRSAPAAPMGDNERYSSEERKLIEKYRELNASGKKLIDTTMNTLLATLTETEKKRKV